MQNLSFAVRKKCRRVPSLKLLSLEAVVKYLDKANLLNQLTDPMKFPAELAFLAKYPFIFANFSLMFRGLFERDKIFTGHTGPVTVVKLNLSSGYALTGSEDKTVRLWNLQDGACVKVFQGITSTITALAFDQEGKFIAAGSADGNVIVWDRETGSYHKIIDEDLGEDHPSIDAIRCVTFCGENRVKFESLMLKIEWDFLSGKTIDGGSRILFFDSGKGRFIIHGDRPDYSNNMYIYERCDNSDERDVQYPLISTLEGHQGDIVSWKISFDDKMIISGDEDGIVKLWNIRTGECLSTFSGFSGFVWAVGFSKDGKCFFTVASDRQKIEISIGEVGKESTELRKCYFITDLIPLEIEGEVNDKIRLKILFSNGAALLIKDEAFNWINHQVIDDLFSLVSFREGGFGLYPVESDFLDVQPLSISSENKNAISRHFDYGWDPYTFIILFGLEDGSCELIKYDNRLSLKQLSFINKLEKKRAAGKKMIIDEEVLASFEPKILDFIREEF